MVCIIPNFLVPHFGENLMKIPPKNTKLQLHENLHKCEQFQHVFIHIFMQIFMSFMVCN